MKASLALLSLLTAFTSHSLKSPAVPPTVVQIQANTNLAIADSARQQIGNTLFYDPAYVRLTYPGGDVPQERGVCSDVVISAGGHGSFGTKMGDYIVAYALPDDVK